MTQEYIRALVDLRDRQIQKARIQFSNRVSAIERGTDDYAHSEQYQTVSRWNQRFDELEKEIEHDITRAVRKEKIFKPLSSLKGIGPMLSAQIISMVDITRAAHISSLWRYAGYGVNSDGERDRPIKGEPLVYNIRLKTSCYKVATQFMKNKNKEYRAIYDKAKEFYSTTKPDWTPGHCDAAAKRKMIKLFLSHLWLVWRELEGLPTSEPYAHAYQNHTHIKTPREFGWVY